MTRARFCLLASLLVMFGAGPVFAQTNVAGDWELTITSPQGERTTPVTLKQDGEKITGMFKSPAGEVPLEGKITGNDLTLTFTLSFQGQPLPITMTGKVDGASIAGKADFGGFAEGEFTAKPAPAATTTAPATTTEPATTEPATTTASTATTAVGAAGNWDVTLKTGGGDFPASATFTDDAGKISGTLVTAMGELPVTGTIEGKTLKLSLVAKTPQGDIPVALTGDVDGDTIINGKADFGGMGQGEWTAKRKQ